MRASRFFPLLLALLLPFAPFTCWSGARAASTDSIDRAIVNGKDWLYKQQTGDNWEFEIDKHGDQKSGHTALVVYSLLLSGEAHQDPRIVKAIEYLKKTDTTGVYALGMRCQVWLSLPQTQDVKAAMIKDATLLSGGLKRTPGDGLGFYDYNTNAGRKYYSHSRGHYGVLGMWAAAQAGVEVPNNYWQVVERAWVGDQDSSGGWNYLGKPSTDYPLTPGMTAAGVATLFVTQDYLHAGDSATPKGNVRNEHIDKGLKWLADNFGMVATDDRSSRSFPFSTLYAIERVGVASGFKLIGPHDWYDKGADWLVKKQYNDGAWPGEFGADKIASSALALIFLSRGREPVAINKLDYAIDENAKPAPNWNNRPRDVANVVRWIGRQSEREFRWQIVDLAAATVDDFHEAPILFISGNQPLNFADEHKKKLKQYVEQGGLIVGHADAASKEFAASFRKLGEEMFPSREFRELPEGHPIYTAEQFPRAKWKTKPSVLSLGNGVREMVVLLPQSDAAKWWQLQLVGGHEDAWQLASDVLLYAVDKKELRRRGETYLVPRNNNVKATRTVPFARVKYDGNWDPEPEGWRRLSNQLHNRQKLDLDFRTATLEKGELAGAKVAHLTGTTPIKLDAAAQKELKDFVDAGGTLIVDAAGGATSFGDSIEPALAGMFPEGLKPVPTDHVIYTAGSKLTGVKYRDFARSQLGSLKDQPRLQGIERNGRLGVIYSREDLSAGLVGQEVDGIIGYAPGSATELMTRIVMHAASATPTTAPAMAPAPTKK